MSHSLIVQQKNRLISELIDEINRLKAGNFTPEEFQALCHNLDQHKPGLTPEEFCNGCEGFQAMMFGKSPIADMRAQAVYFARAIFTAECGQKHWNRPQTQSAKEAAEYLHSAGLLEKDGDLYRWKEQA